ncbi:MAG: GNAT family N-acetyltransferase [Theionarchaea archaeon]|nr:GNAT family N-acetyltransferase [Theionarchaea archaeon]MBU7000100.1 GNAT family N-acetyltransferase [Theionarchaea archaeon]MBU7020817.1 GNAT family N-acetyltransferase [Theionarchaea archaeon]MBU7033947.1 GNAT family N-acetyltransferase [Theionarchaea archaeon]MBU7039243.1 GNAT family N-acetyltransferase [Theionarchaea archaeon]
MRDLRYVFLKEERHLVAVACCFPYREKMYVEMPFLEVRSPLGTNLAFFSQTSEHACSLLRELEKIRRKVKASGLMIMDLKNHELTSLKNQMTGFTEFQVDDNTYMDLNFSDFEDYLGSLNGKSRRSVRATLNRAEKLGIQCVFSHDFLKWKDTVRKLQKYLCDRFRNYRWYLSEEFFSALETYLKNEAELVLFSREDVPLVFAMSLNSAEICQYKFMGTDPKYRDYQAYFLVYYEGIRRALEKRQKRIYFGPSTYEFKEKIGCKREGVFGLAAFRNPFLNVALKTYIAMLTKAGKRIE